MNGISPKYFYSFAITYGLSIPEGEGAEIEGFLLLYKEKKLVKPQPYMPQIGRYLDAHSFIKNLVIIRILIAQCHLWRSNFPTSKVKKCNEKIGITVKINVRLSKKA
jgi:hypothetical protein